MTGEAHEGAAKVAIAGNLVSDRFGSVLADQRDPIVFERNATKELALMTSRNQKTGGKFVERQFLCHNAIAAIFVVGFLVSLGTTFEDKAKDLWVPLSGADCKI